MALEMERDPEAFHARLQKRFDDFPGRVVGFDLKPIKKMTQRSTISKRSKSGSP
jgi:hypothetical protein